MMPVHSATDPDAMALMGAPVEGVSPSGKDVGISEVVEEKP